MVNDELVILTTAVNGCIVLVDHVLTLFAVGLNDEVFHLLNGFLNRDNAGDTKESRLQNGVGAVAQTYLHIS